MAICVCSPCQVLSQVHTLSKHRWICTVYFGISVVWYPVLCQSHGSPIFILSASLCKYISLSTQEMECKHRNCAKETICKKLVGDSHHGFTEGKSCLANLVVFYNRITALIDERRPTDIIYLDLCESFGTVLHSIFKLVFKLESHGFEGHLVDKKVSGWMHSKGWGQQLDVETKTIDLWCFLRVSRETSTL